MRRASHRGRDLCGSTYRSSLEESGSQRQDVDGGRPGTGRGVVDWGQGAPWRSQAHRNRTWMVGDQGRGGELLTGDRASFWEEQGLEVMVRMVAQCECTYRH